MITKEKYNQQDVDYAFSLGKKERQGGVDSDMFEQDWNDPTMANMKNPSASASGTYKMLIMKAVFGGMKDRFENEFKDSKDAKSMGEWLITDTVNCIKGHQEEMKSIIRGLKRTTEEPDQAKLRAGFSELLTIWLFQLFRGGRDPNQYRMFVKILTGIRSDVMKETDKIITKVMEEA